LRVSCRLRTAAGGTVNSGIQLTARVTAAAADGQHMGFWSSASRQDHKVRYRQHCSKRAAWLHMRQESHVISGFGHDKERSGRVPCPGLTASSGRADLVFRIHRRYQRASACGLLSVALRERALDTVQAPKPSWCPCPPASAQAQGSRRAPILMPDPSWHATSGCGWVNERNDAGSGLNPRWFPSRDGQQLQLLRAITWRPPGLWTNA